MEVESWKKFVIRELVKYDSLKEMAEDLGVRHLGNPLYLEWCNGYVLHGDPFSTDEIAERGELHYSYIAYCVCPEYESMIKGEKSGEIQILDSSNWTSAKEIVKEIKKIEASKKRDE